ncbi:MAG: ABC transporter permease [Leucobacter sp.]
MDLLRISPLRAVVAAVLALVVSAFASLTVGVSPWATLTTLVAGATGSTYALGSTLNAAAVLILLGLSFAFGLRGHVINIGIQGQFLLGTVGALMVATWVDLPPILHLAACLVGGALGGAAWALIPALMKMKRGANELVTTLMMNFIGIAFVAYLLRGPLKAENSDLPQSVVLPESARLPIIIPESRASAGILVALGCVLLIGFLLRYTKWGFRLRSVGMNPEAARYAGFGVRSINLQAFLVSGALSGIAGAVVLMGEKYRLQEGLIDNWYIGVVVGLIGGGAALGCLIAGLGFGALAAGAFEAQLNLGVPASIVNLMQGVIIVVFLLVSRLPDIRALIARSRPARPQPAPAREEEHAP